MTFNDLDTLHGHLQIGNHIGDASLSSALKIIVEELKKLRDEATARHGKANAAQVPDVGRT